MKFLDPVLKLTNSCFQQVTLLLIVNWVGLTSVFASTEVSQNQLSQHKFLLLPEQRQEIEQARTKYLKSLLNSPKDASTTSSGKKKSPYKLLRFVLRSAIIDSFGEGQIQLNSHWYKQNNSPIPFKIDPNNPAVVRFLIGKKAWRVPVGSTLLLDKRLGRHQIKPHSKINIQAATHSP